MNIEQLERANYLAGYIKRLEKVLSAFEYTEELGVRDYKKSPVVSVIIDDKNKGSNRITFSFDADINDAAIDAVRGVVEKHVAAARAEFDLL